MVIVFQTSQLLVLGVFGFFISDFRRKPGMVPLLNPRAIIAMKLCYPVPILTYAYILVTVPALNLWDFAALAVTIAGTLLVAVAKTHLGGSHAWTGHYRSNVPIITRGIYRWVRHPLYIGIATVICGSLFTIIPHGNPIASATVVLFVAGILFFLVLSARVETRQLEKDRGEAFMKYRQSVHPFLPGVHPGRPPKIPHLWPPQNPPPGLS